MSFLSFHALGGRKNPSSTTVADKIALFGNKRKNRPPVTDDYVKVDVNLRLVGLGLPEVVEVARAHHDSPTPDRMIRRRLIR